MQLVLNTYGLHLSQRNRCFQIEAKTGINRIISPLRISSILVTRNINITSSAILLAAEHNIPIVLVDNTGQPMVKISQLMSAGLTNLRKMQLSFSGSKASVDIIKEMLLGKTEAQIANLAWWANRKPALATECLQARDQLVEALHRLDDEASKITQLGSVNSSLHAWEGMAARYYWQAVAQLATHESWLMKGRSYRPAEDEFNASLNYLYGLLYNQVETALASAGLDSQIGIWHRDEYQTPSLAFDAIEPFRPKVDRLLMEQVFLKTMTPSHFEPHAKWGFLLNREGKAVLITTFNNHLEEKLKIGGKVTSLKNHILQMAYFIKNYIEGRTQYE